MKTICFFTAHYLPYLGGVERYTYNLAKSLIEDGNRVIIVTSEMDQEPKKKNENGIEIIRTDAIPFMNDRLPIYKLSKSNSQVMNYLEKQDISFVIINTKFYPITYIGARFAKKHNIPSIVIEHGTGHLEFGSRAINRIGEMYEHFMAKLHWSQCRHFVGVSNECNMWLQHFGINAKDIMYNAVDYSGIQRIMEISEKRICDDKISITYTGRILKEKGICKLLDAFVLLEEHYNNIVLEIAGDGPILKELEAKYENDDNIVFWGHLGFKDVVRVLSNSDVYCFPTDYPEGLPTCVLEAMACGVYTITSSSGGAKEVIIDENMGVILKENTVEEIAIELERAISDAQRRRLVAAEGQKRVREEFDWKSTRNTLYKLMEDKMA